MPESVADTGNFLATHPGRDRATTITPVEIDGATQVWHLWRIVLSFERQPFPVMGNATRDTYCGADIHPRGENEC